MRAEIALRSPKNSTEVSLRDDRARGPAELVPDDRMLPGYPGIPLAAPFALDPPAQIATAVRATATINHRTVSPEPSFGELHASFDL